MNTESGRAEAVARFHRALVEEIVRTRPAYLSEPFTVAEIYQNLVPYRTHRDRIGVEMNGDYEDALLRLLAGEGDYLVLESDHARSHITEELGSPNPNTGLYREFAAVDVRLNPLRMPRDLPDPVRGPLVGAFDTPDIDFADAQPRAHAPPAARAAHAPPVPSRPAASGVGPVPAEPPLHLASAGCPWCRETLPPHVPLNYCPFCGADLQTAPCKTCGEELHVGWRFCVACGTPAGGVD
ncbi:MAG: zinc ribbon domain-containing protein [Gemmatimonadetes bacterium]|nr:zinc ribbon domain-containing protein [Gemmatimonadota bacterium]